MGSTAWTSTRTIDFGALFGRLESAGYAKHYTMAFGGDAEKLTARDRLVA